jgi:hypothetical protein
MPSNGFIPDSIYIFYSFCSFNFYVKFMERTCKR